MFELENIKTRKKLIEVTLPLDAINTVTRNEILYSLNRPQGYILGIVEFQDGDEYQVHYVRQPFHREPDFGVTSVNYNFTELLARAEAPS